MLDFLCSVNPTVENTKTPVDAQELNSEDRRLRGHRRQRGTEKNGLNIERELENNLFPENEVGHLPGNVSVKMNRSTTR